MTKPPSNKIITQQKKAPLWVGVLIVVVIVGVLYKMCGSSTEQKADNLKSESFVISKHFMRDALKAPSTADFPTIDYTSEYVGDSTYIVKSYVDAQNSFGAKLRTYYEATLKWNGGEWADRNNWTLVTLTTQ